MSNFSLTVNKLVQIYESEGRLDAFGVEREASFDNGELLAHGRDLAESAFAQEGWKSITFPCAKPPAFDRLRTYIFKKCPPAIPRSEKGTSASPREWGDLSATATEEETDISKLEEFKSMDIEEWLMKGRFEQRLQLKRARTDDTETETLNKKRKKVKGLNLYEILPQPHYYSYPRSIPLPAETEEVTKRFKPYSKSPFRPVAPHTFETVKAYLKQPYARSAWIVPVCGRTPWEGASPGIIRSEQKRSNNAIRWTPSASKEFWNFLLEVRKNGVLGAISLSYHVAPTEGTENILQCTHIKIYHDARFALYVRAVLDAWRAQVEDGVDGGKTAVRLLLGKVLPLIDERGVVIGMC